MITPIYLDVDDEITSAVTRIRAAGPGRVVVVVPFGSRLASSRINFRLLAREASSLGRELAVVAPEPAVRALAASADLPTYATVLELDSAAPSGGGDHEPGHALVRQSGGGLRGVAAAPGLVETPPPGAPGAAGAGSGQASDLPARARAPGVEERPGGSSQDDPAGWARRARVYPDPEPPETGRGDPGGRRRMVIAAGVVLVAVLVVASAGFAAINLLPTARITITPATRSLGPLELSVTADPTEAAADAARLVIPAIRIDVPAEASGQFEATGKELIEKKATGSVTFQNCDTGSAHTFPTGTVVATGDGVTFVTGSSVRLDRAKINPAFACTAGSTSVTASKAGPEGNVVAGAIEKLPAAYDPVVLTVVNRAATSGGSRTELTRVTQADVDGALAALRTQLAEAFAAAAANPEGRPAGSEVIAGTATLGDPAPTLDPDALVGRELQSFDLGLTAVGTVLAVDPSPVAKVALTRLTAAVPSGFQLMDGSVRTTVQPPVVSGGTVVYAVTVRGELSRIVDLAALRQQVLGLSIPAARKIVEPYGAVEVTVWPDWVTAVPSDPARVELVLGDAAESGPPAAPGPSASASPGGTR